MLLQEDELTHDYSWAANTVNITDDIDDRQAKRQRKSKEVQVADNKRQRLFIGTISHASVLCSSLLQTSGVRLHFILLMTSISCRPTHFIAAQVSHEKQIIEAIQEVQKAIVGHTAALRDTLVEPATAHFTLMVQSCLYSCSAIASSCRFLRYPEQPVTVIADAI